MLTKRQSHAFTERAYSNQSRKNVRGDGQHDNAKRATEGHSLVTRASRSSYQQDNDNLQPGSRAHDDSAASSTTRTRNRGWDDVHPKQS